MIFVLFIVSVFLCGFLSKLCRLKELSWKKTIGFGFGYGLFVVLLFGEYADNLKQGNIVSWEAEDDSIFLWWALLFPVITALYFFLDYAKEKWGIK